MLGGDVGSLEGGVRGHRPQRLPVVLTEDEVRRALSNLQGTPALVAQILYGSGLRLMEALCLRIKDMDFEKNSIVVRDGKAMRATVQAAGIHKPEKCHTMRYSFAAHLLERGYAIRTIQELLGHSDVKTTMIYTYALNRGVVGVNSPADFLFS